MENPSAPVLPVLSILIVNYNTRDLTLACLESIRHYPPQGNYEIILVDNDSKDGSIEAIADKYPEVQLIASDVNHGFAKGNNLAMRVARGDVLVLLNSDTVVYEGTLTALQQAFHDNPHMAGAGGKLLNGDGSLQFGIRYYPRVSNQLSEMFFLHRLFDGPIWSEVEHRSSCYEEIHEIEAFSGAYLSIRREWYERIGGLDAGFFMYSEDIDWCRRLTTAGGKLYYLPESIVTHYGGQSSKGSPRLFIVRNQARDRYLRLHLSPIAAAIGRFILSMNLVMRAIFHIPLAIIKPELWKSIGWRLQGAVRLYTQPLPLDTDYD